MYRVFEHSQVVLSGFQCMYVIHEASLQSHELFYIWTTPANLKIQLKPSMSEIRNYLVANPIYILCSCLFLSSLTRLMLTTFLVTWWNVVSFGD